MKKTTFFLPLLCVTQILFAQWTTVSGTNNIYNTALGYVGIGTSNPTAPLDINGLVHTNYLFVNDAPSAGAIGIWVRGFSTGSGNLVLQANGGNSQAYWITGADGMLKLGGNGGTEPTVGAININYLGNVGVGTTNPGSFKMAVEGSFGARSVKVTLTNPWPDYVFGRKYALPTLTSVEKYIQENKHLPGIPSADDIKQGGGVDLGEMNTRLLEKVEELTLYVIQIKKENERILRENREIKKQLRKK
jgi:hypothetical protein